ncbi:hypothetical protein L9F63_017016, partial [Diploptera punctata]
LPLLVKPTLTRDSRPVRVIQTSVELPVSVPELIIVRTPTLCTCESAICDAGGERNSRRLQ